MNVNYQRCFNVDSTLMCLLGSCFWKQNILGTGRKSAAHPTDTTRWFDAGSMPILRRYVENKISTNFCLIFTCLFDIILMRENSPLFRHTYFNVISMAKKSKLFQRVLFALISVDKKSTLFRHTLFDIILMNGKLTSFHRTLFYAILFVEKLTPFQYTTFDVISTVEK